MSGEKQPGRVGRVGRAGAYRVVTLLLTAVPVALDQLTKQAAAHGLADGPISVWDGVIEFCYSENRGIAWGFLQNRRWPVVVVTGLMLALLLAALLSGRFRGSRCLTIGGILVVAGGVGNLIDRIVNGYVVDFIHYYKWFDFPIFNVADCCVTIGAILILLYLFFSKDKSEELKEEPTPTKEAADGAASTEPDDTTGGGEA